MHLSSSPYMLHAHPSHSSWFDHTNIWGGVKIIKLLITPSFLWPSHLGPLRPPYLSQPPILKHSQPNTEKKCKTLDTFQCPLATMPWKVSWIWNKWHCSIWNYTWSECSKQQAGEHSVNKMAARSPYNEFHVISEYDWSETM